MNTRIFKLSIRNILKNKLNSAIIIISLALALSVGFVILSWALFEYSYDNFHRNKDRIYRVIDHQTFKGQDEQYLAQIPEYLVNTFENEIPGIELSTILLPTGNFWISEGQKNVEITNVCYSDNNLFNVFSFKFISGDPKTCLSSSENAVITKQTAAKLFGKGNPIGKIIRRDSTKAYVVSAVMEDIPTNSHLNFNMLLPINERKPAWDGRNGNHNASIYVLLKKGIRASDLKNNLHLFTNRHFTRNPEKYDMQLQPLGDLHLNSDQTIWEINKNKFNKTYVAILLVIAFLLLSISAINFFNLTLAGLSKRKTEIGIKKIIGSGRLQIIRQVLLENFILAGVACILAGVIVAYLYPYIKTSFFNEYDFSDIFNFKTIILCVSIVIAIVLITGLFPSISYSSLSPVSTFSGKISKNLTLKSFNQTLVVSQLGVTTFLIIATLCISKQMMYVRNKDLGVKTDQVLILPTNGAIRTNYQILKEELLKNPGISNVTASNRVVGEDFWRNTIKFEGQDPESRYSIPFLITDYNFTEFYDLKVVKGRTFSREFKPDLEGQSYLINESLARELGYSDPVGKKMRFSHTQMGEIIGVVKDFHFQSLHKPIEPMALYVGENELYEISVKVSPHGIDRTLAFIEKTWKTFCPDRPFTYQFLDEQFANLYNNDTKTTKLVIIFTILSIILSSLGLFGLISFVSEQKTKEIGIRKVNGAKISEIVSMLSKNYITWGVIGFIIASPVGYYVMHKWLQSFVYKTELSWWIFVLAGILVIFIAGLTVSWQSYKAASRNPVESLRYE
ncbi:MAG TPA: FtsX-like permease family protein [Bacteroidales bacterium]